MAFDDGLATRVRGALADTEGVAEKRMFGGLAFLLKGNMCVGVHGDELIVRLDHDEGEHAVAQGDARVFDLTGRPMKGWVLVARDGTETDEALRAWIEHGVACASSLPPK